MRGFLDKLIKWGGWVVALAQAIYNTLPAWGTALFLRYFVGPLSELGALSTPVHFSWSQSIAAGATFNPLTDWQYETPDFPGMIEVFSRATAVGLLETISSAGETLKQESPVQAGGTAGTIPSRLNTEPVVGRAAPLQKVRVFYRNPTGGAITVDGAIILTPLGGGGGGRGGARRGGGRRGRR